MGQGNSGSVALFHGGNHEEDLPGIDQATGLASGFIPDI